MNLKLKTYRKGVFIALALSFQIISFYASFEGIKETFIAQPILAAIFACALNLSLLVAWHEFQQDPRAGFENEDFAKRRSLAFSIGVALLCLSAFLSSIGMYSVLGFRSGMETDSTAENNQMLQRSKEIFNKVKDAAAKHLDTQKTENEQKLDAAKKRLAQTNRGRRSVKAEEVRQFEAKIKAIEESKTKLTAEKPVSDEKLSIEQRNSEIQTQITNLFSNYQVQRDSVLSVDDKMTLTFTEPLNRNLYDQLIADLQNRKPLAIASIAFGISPDLFAVALLFVGTPRKKSWRRIRDSKEWVVRLVREIFAPVGLSISPAVEIVVKDENQNPIAQLAVSIDLNREVSEETIRAFFPGIVDRLTEYFGQRFEIRELPENWRSALVAGEPLELTAVEI